MYEKVVYRITYITIYIYIYIYNDHIDQWKIYDTYTKYTKIYDIVLIVSVGAVT